MAVNNKESIDFVEANSPTALKKACLALQVNSGFKYAFRNISQTNAGTWIAWYERNMSNEYKVIKKDKLKGNK